MVKTRAALREALLALIEEKPFDQIAIREITARAEVGYASFFRHYPSKDALLSDLAAEQIRTLIRLNLPAFEATDTRAAAHSVCAYVDAHRRTWSALLTGGAAGAMREEFIRQTSLIGVERSRPSGWLPPGLAIVFGVTAMVEVMAWWLARREQYPVEQMAEILDRLVLSPVASSLPPSNEAFEVDKKGSNSNI